MVTTSFFIILLSLLNFCHIINMFHLNPSLLVVLVQLTGEIDNFIQGYRKKRPSQDQEVQNGRELHHIYEIALPTLASQARAGCGHKRCTLADSTQLLRTTELNLER